MFFNVGDVVITDSFDLMGIPLTVVRVCPRLRVCECKYIVDGVIFYQDFRIIDLVRIVEI